MIADAARTLPLTLRRVDVGDETLAELEVLDGFGDDLAGEATRVANRIRGLLTQVHPALERVLGPKVQHKAVLALRRPAARILLEVGDGISFATPGHLAAYAGLAPVTRRKGAQGKRHSAALICLARRRVDVLFATLRDAP